MQSLSRAYKRDCLKDVLDRYHLFLNVASYPEDVRLIFFLTICRMIDRAAGRTDDEQQQQLQPSINFTAIQTNSDRLFRRYVFDDRCTELENIERFVDALLDAPDDSTARFL